MAQYMVHFNPTPEECPCSNEIDSPTLKGKSFFCTCPSDVIHGGFFEIEARSPEEALNLFPEDMRRVTKVYAGETMTVA